MMTIFKKSDDKSKETIKDMMQPEKKPRRMKKISSVLSTLSNYLRISHTEIKPSKKTEPFKIANTANPVGRKEPTYDVNECLPSLENESKQAIDINAIPFDVRSDDSKKQEGSTPPKETKLDAVPSFPPSTTNENPSDNLRKIKNCIKDKELECEKPPLSIPNKPTSESNKISQKYAEKESQREDTKNNSVEYEARYCTVCNLEQPLRTKHCKVCGRCIATFDHHCDWVGNCIGEWNRRYFMMYIWLQFFAIAWITVEAITSIKYEDGANQWFMMNWPVFIVLIGNMYFYYLVGSLLIFHTYLILTNTTTWECLSWEKISYLKNWDVIWGSPFDEGLKSNIRHYCRVSSELIFWQFPKQETNKKQKKLYNCFRKCWSSCFRKSNR